MLPMAFSKTSPPPPVLPWVSILPVLMATISLLRSKAIDSDLELEASMVTLPPLVLLLLWEKVRMSRVAIAPRLVVRNTAPPELCSELVSKSLVVISPLLLVKVIGLLWLIMSPTVMLPCAWNLISPSPVMFCSWPLIVSASRVRESWKVLSPTMFIVAWSSLPMVIRLKPSCIDSSFVVVKSSEVVSPAPPMLIFWTLDKVWMNSSPVPETTPPQVISSPFRMRLPLPPAI